MNKKGDCRAPCFGWRLKAEIHVNQTITKSTWSSCLNVCIRGREFPFSTERSTDV